MNDKTTAWELDCDWIRARKPDVSEELMDEFAERVWERIGRDLFSYQWSTNLEMLRNRVLMELFPDEPFPEK